MIFLEETCYEINSTMKLFSNPSQTYTRLVDRARGRMLVEGYEKHHVIPKCMGGTDDPENIVKLTLREHFICHKLLIRMTEGDVRRKLEHAFSYMVLTKNTIRPTHRVTSHDYELARKYAAKSRPKSWGENISKAKLGKKLSPEAVAKMRATLTGRALSSSHKTKIGLGSRGRKHAQSAIDKMREAKGKAFTVVLPSGDSQTIRNLKSWAIENNFNYHTLINNSKLPNPIRWGVLKGYKVSTSTS